MKFSFKIISLTLLVFATLSSCTDPDIVTKAEENTFNKEGAIVNVIDVAPGIFDLGDIPNAQVGYTLTTAGTDVSSTDVMLSRDGGEYQLLETISSFPASNVLTLIEVADFFGITTDDIAVGEVFTMKFVSTASDGVFETGKKFNMVATCNSILAGMYEYSTTGYFCDDIGALTGTVELAEVDAGIYTWSDWAFGSYQQCYGGPAAGWGTLQVTDICNKLTISGEDGYGDTWSYKDLVVSGNTMTFTWENTYGEAATTTITKGDGDFPPLVL